jgi:hypothetical protein
LGRTLTVVGSAPHEVTWAIGSALQATQFGKLKLDGTSLYSQHYQGAHEIVTTVPTPEVQHSIERT